MLVVIILSSMNIQMWDYYNEECNKLNGSLVTYECYNSGLNNYCDLDTTKTGQWCVLSNGSEIDLTIKSIQN